MSRAIAPRALVGPLLALALFFTATHRASAMIYKPEKVIDMWDSWVVFHEGKFYLYYLESNHAILHGVSLATSDDGVHYTEVGTVVPKSPEAVWLGSGSVWKKPGSEPAEWVMNFSESKDGLQRIYFATSTDLRNWNRLSHDFRFQQDERWYHPDGRWDCICALPRKEGGLYGYWTATPRGAVGFGFGQSLDGIKWEALKPPTIDWTGRPVMKKSEVSMEAGAVEHIRDKYYMMSGTPRYEGRSGMVTMVADKPSGPFRPAAKNLHLLTAAGHEPLKGSPFEKMCPNYFTRFVRTPDALLVNHHAIGRKGTHGGSYFAPLKKATVDDEGTLRLTYWPGNEKLKGEVISTQLENSTSSGPASVRKVSRKFDVGPGVVLEGEMTLPSKGGEEEPGLFIAWAEQEGVAIRVGKKGVTRCGTRRTDTGAFQQEEEYDREFEFGKVARFKLLLRHSLLEFYLDDILIQGYSLPKGDKASGVVGVMGAVQKLQAWQMTLAG